MAYASPTDVPGAYDISEQTTSSTNLNANLFRPPTSPSTSTYNLSKSTGSLLSDNTSMTNNTPMHILGRKRTHDESRGLKQTNYYDNDSAMEDSANGQDRYTLAGQINTPGAQALGNGVLEDSLYSDIDYRRRLELGSKRPHDEPGSPSFGLSGLGIADSETPTSPRAAGWTTFAFQAIGGVVGKVWEFCRGGTGTFRGFQAGGGKPYEPNGQPAPDPTPTVDTNHFSPDTPVGFEEQEVPISPPDIFPNVDMISPNPDSIPVHHDHDYNRDQAQREVLQGDEDRQLHREPSPVQEKTPERPAVKRRRTSINGENDELRRHWVMVEDDEPPSAPLVHRPALTTKRSSAASPAASRLPTSGRSNLVSRLQPPRITPTNTPSRRISAPSPRFGLGSEQKSGIPPPRATSRLSFGSNASYAGLGHSPSLVTGDIASFASPRSPQQPETPVLSPTGSRIPQPRGFGPNPFAATRTASPVPRATPSRPSSRQSMQPSPLAPSLTPSFIPKSTPTHGHHSGHRRSISSVSAGRKSGINVQASPRLDQQAKQLVTKRMAVEKKTDSRLDRLNGELQALIRQGQEALGTNFDVEMDEDERWEEA